MKLLKSEVAALTKKWLAEKGGFYVHAFVNSTTYRPYTGREPGYTIVELGLPVILNDRADRPKKGIFLGSIDIHDTGEIAVSADMGEAIQRQIGCNELHVVTKNGIHPLDTAVTRFVRATIGSDEKPSWLHGMEVTGERTTPEGYVVDCLVMVKSLADTRVQLPVKICTSESWQKHYVKQYETHIKKIIVLVVLPEHSDQDIRTRAYHLMAEMRNQRHHE